MKKTFSIIMLPTKEATNLWLMHNKNQGLMKLETATGLDGIPQHLYIISDDEIKEGDWCYDFLFGMWEYKGKLQKEKQPASYTKKIIATTNISLKELVNSESAGFDVPVGIPLPQLPESFIHAYIKAYNEGKPITEVDLEMLILTSGSSSQELETNTLLILKTREDNTVIVHQSKKHSTLEVEKLIREWASFTCTGAGQQWTPQDLDEWINKNLYR